MEKLILALITTSRKLQPYFQAHTVEVPTEYSMKQILHKLETYGRLIEWVIELSEFDIKYKPRTAVKGQILADFIMEFTPDLGRFHHGIHSSTVYGGYPTGT